MNEKKVAGTKTLLGATMTISEELIRKVDAKGL